MNTNNLYNIFSEDNEISKSNLSASEVIDYANAVFYYEIQDNEEEEISSFEEAVELFRQNNMEVIQVLKRGGVINNENAEMVQNQNRQIGHHTKELSSALKGSKEVPAWVVAKVNRSATDLSDATHYLEGSKLMALGGNIDEYTAKEFFDGLNLSVLPNEVREYIQNEIISDSNLDLVSVDDETLKMVRNLIAKKYPKSLEVEEVLTETNTTTDDNEDVIKYRKEIEDLEVLISIEDDSEMIKKYEKEIEDLNTLIELEN